MSEYPHVQLRHGGFWHGQNIRIDMRGTWNFLRSVSGTRVDRTVLPLLLVPAYLHDNNTPLPPPRSPHSPVRLPSSSYQQYTDFSMEGGRSWSHLPSPGLRKLWRGLGCRFWGSGFGLRCAIRRMHLEAQQSQPAAVFQLNRGQAFKVLLCHPQLSNIGDQKNFLYYFLGGFLVIIV